MDPALLPFIALLMFVAAALYSSVGHGGASAYLAIMALFSVAPDAMKPTALVLNLAVSALGAMRFALLKQMNAGLLFAFAITAAPAAWLGGQIALEPSLYRPLVGLVLLASAVRLFWQPERIAAHRPTAPAPALTLPVGAGLGFLAGLTGTGGGIFLSPLIILAGWETPRRTSGIAAAFIFINSAAGLLGNVSAVGSLPNGVGWLLGAVIAGGLIGSWLGTERLPQPRLLQALALVLFTAGGKLIGS